ncbi:MAG: hypothetical protein IT167_05595 [Bryobacterales bacterium]|nr:hypothetical protein [Bryobacterales bacterium]
MDKTELMSYVTTQRERDKAVILSVVRSFGPVSQVDIRHLTHLRASSISQLVNELLEEGRLKISGRNDNPTGRKQILLGINEEQGFLLGIEFDSEFVVAGAMDLTPRIRSLAKQPAIRDKGVSGLVEQLKRCARRALEQARIPPRRLRWYRHCGCRAGQSPRRDIRNVVTA